MWGRGEGDAAGEDKRFVAIVLAARGMWTHNQNQAAGSVGDRHPAKVLPGTTSRTSVRTETQETSRREDYLMAGARTRGRVKRVGRGHCMHRDASTAGIHRLRNRVGWRTHSYNSEGCSAINPLQKASILSITIFGVYAPEIFTSHCDDLLMLV